MEIARIRVQQTSLDLKQSACVTKGMVGAAVVFEYFGPEWAGLSKTAIFRARTTSRDVINVQEGVPVVIPWEVLDAVLADLQVGVCGHNDNGMLVIPTVWGSLGRIDIGALPVDRPPQPPTPHWTAQIEAQVNQAMEAAQAVGPLARQAADAAAAAAVSAASADSDARRAAQASQQARQQAVESGNYSDVSVKAMRSAIEQADAALDAQQAAAADAAAASGAASRAAADAQTADTAAEAAAGHADRAALAADRAESLIDDSTISKDSVYSSSKIYDTFCPPMDVSGKVITVYPAGDYPMELTTVFTAVQTGTGPASPTNIRAIKGFNGAKISQMGENLYHQRNLKEENAVTVQSIPGGFRLTKTNKTQYSSAQISGIHLEKGKEYVVYASIKPSAQSPHLLISVIDRAGAYKGTIYDSGSGSYYCDETGEYAIRVYVNFNDSAVGDYTDFTNVIITEKSPFHQHIIDFGRTAYTAEYHWNSGQLVLKSEMVNLRGGNVSAYAFGGHQGVAISGRMTQSAARAVGLCTHATVSGPHRIGVESPSWIWAGVNNNIIYWIDILDVLGISLETFRDEWIQQNDVFLVYEFPAPIVVPLTPAEIRNLPGGNTFISDIGDTRVLGRESFSHAFEEINQKMEALQKAALGGI